MWNDATNLCNRMRLDQSIGTLVNDSFTFNTRYELWRNARLLPAMDRLTQSVYNSLTAFTEEIQDSGYE